MQMMRGGMPMYAALWRILPGPWWVRAIILLAAAGAVLYVLFMIVFPWANGVIDPQDVTVD
jgi:hypothetical protein